MAYGRRALVDRIRFVGGANGVCGFRIKVVELGITGGIESKLASLVV